MHPQNPVVESKAPSEKVTNGTLFESGSIDVESGVKLVFPSDFEIETYEGKRVRFYVTKTLRCKGHPPVPMKITEVRSYFGVAQRLTDRQIEFCSYGEWRNKGGSASIRVLVLLPKGIEYKQTDELNGPNSPACDDMDRNLPEMKVSYWYSGVRPRENWTAISTELNFNRFLKPE